MKIAGVIAEYDPFHSGHAHQLTRLRALGAEKIIVAMSTGTVQRGGFSVLPWETRVRAALSCGADLVAALPAPWACSSAEGFAAAGVRLLTALGCDTLAFGAETPQREALEALAALLDSEALREPLKKQLDTGLSFAPARAAAVRQLAPDLAPLLNSPNNLLGVEYCKAIRRQQSPLQPLPLQRLGAGHGEALDAHPLTASGSAIRKAWLAGEWEAACPYLPETAWEIYREAIGEGKLLSPLRMETAILSRLRGMDTARFSAVRGVNEGLEHRLAAALQNATSLEMLYDTLKTRRYAHARLRRLVLDAALGYGRTLPELPPFALVLGARREALSLCKAAALPCGTGLAGLAGQNEACAATAAAHAAACDLSALCREQPLPMGLAYTQKPVLL